MKPPFYAVQHPPDPLAERVSTVTADGVTLRGSVHRSPDGAPRGVIVFCPELDGNHWSAGWYAEALIESGFDVVAFDFLHDLVGFANLFVFQVEHRIDQVLALEQAKAHLVADARAA